ncbi:MAG: aminoacetone oxidase family FAD-binding enzyme [Phycisphaerae bacterium]|nr:aminoacetone oxidase family FAD-binding enzyme [Phycisphaerae bacterium]
MQPEKADIAVIGAGAAGLMAAIAAGREARRSLRVVALDGARTLGAKILVAGGGRCNVTHHEVSEADFAGASRHAIKQVLRAFDVPSTVGFFRDIGVELKREETGKLFPVTDNARTVLNALLTAAREAGVEIRHPFRVDRIVRGPGHGFLVTEAASQAVSSGGPRALEASRVILATGGRALPKSGSDGHGYTIARSLGHTITPAIHPALVPLLLPEGHFLRALSGVTFNATLELRSPTGKRLVSFTGSTLCTHFGLSGPSVLDISRHYLSACEAARTTPGGEDPQASLFLNCLPSEPADMLDARLVALGMRTPASYLRERFPERLAHALCIEARVDPGAPASALTRDQRRSLVRTVTELRLPITGDRGFTHAEATAGGVPLSELFLQSMESRITPGLHIIGELCDVDGRIGGFNFQWAWSSGHVAGEAAAHSLQRAGSTRG